MAVSTNEELIDTVIRCPACRGGLQRKSGRWQCESCGEDYCIQKSGTIDLRLQRETIRTVQVFLGGSQSSNDSVPVTELSVNPNPSADLTGVSPPKHVSTELMSWFPAASSDTSLALDIGCGEGQNRRVVEMLGYHYVGVDFCDVGATILGDAQALPFGDESFEFALSIAVAEHVPYPQLKFRELFRVLQPRGILLGTVSFMEPFHGSFSHHSHWGVMHLLQEAGFTVQHIGPMREYGVLTAQRSLGLFPGMPSRISGLLLAPISWMHRVWYAIGRWLRDPAVFSEERRKIITAGSLQFIAQKQAG